MLKIAVITLSLGVACSAQAGCLAGAAAGGVVGHMAGHHGVMGAAIGCAVGHHHAAKARQEAHDSQNQGDPNSAH